MKTVKNVSKISGVSVRTLRYYDEIGLLKPTKLTDAGYRLYDDKALEKLQEIMVFRELDIPLADIKKVMENPDYDREQMLLAQKAFLERKRNRLNGIIELISDVAKEENNPQLAEKAVELLAENYKAMFQLDNARSILLDLAKEYLTLDKLAEVTDRQYGDGCAEYVAKAIQLYYGV